MSTTQGTADKVMKSAVVEMIRMEEGHVREHRFELASAEARLAYYKNLVGGMSTEDANIELEAEYAIIDAEKLAAA